MTATDPVPESAPAPRMVLWPLGILAILLAAAAVWYARLPVVNVRGPARLALVLGPGVVAILWSLLAFALAFRPPFPQVPARWWLIAMAGLFEALGFVVYAFRDQTPNIRLPGPAAEAVSLTMQLCFLAVQPLLLLGLAAFPSTELGRLARRRYLLDATIIALSGALVLWAVSSQRAMLVGSGRPSLLQVVYAVGDLLVLFTLATHLFRLSPKLPLWQGLALLTLGAGLLLLTNSWVPNQPGAASLRGALPHERTFYAELLLVAGFAWLWVCAGVQGTPTTAERRASGVGLVSFGALAAGYVLLAVVASRSESRLVIGLTIGAAVLTAVVVLRQIVTVRENLDHEARRTRRSVEERFESLVANASEAIVVVDRDGTVLYASPSVQRLLGFVPEDVIGRPFDQLLHPEESIAARTFLHELLARPWGSTVRSWRLRRADGGFAWGETTATNLLADPNVRGIVLNTRDITERRELEQRLTHQAMHDGLTGLANRVMLRNRLETVLRRPRPGASLPPALLFLDLDGFKNVNDTFGHAQGDALLIAAATRLREQVGAQDIVARLGGDEFAVLLESPRDRQAVLDIAQRITNALKVPFRVFGRETAGSASIGVAIAEPTDSAGDVLRHSDVAMYLAKANGRGRYELFEPRMLESVVGRLGLQSDLRRALENPDSRELLLDYQPIVELATQRVVGVEALLRWDHPVQGRITPAVFVPLAEETGLIVPLGRRALHLACNDSAPWVREHPGMHVTVNLSARQLPDPALAAEVAAAVAESGLPPASLVLELTESAIMQQPERSAQVFRELRGLGVRLAIDDFGTGYSSLSYLQQLPAAILKIDRSFLTSLDQGPNGATLVRGIIGLANGLGLITVAEGIETEEQFMILRTLGCSCGQGLLFSPPLPAVQVSGWLEDAAVISASGGAKVLGR